VVGPEYEEASSQATELVFYVSQEAPRLLGQADRAKAEQDCRQVPTQLAEDKMLNHAGTMEKTSPARKAP